MHERAIPASTGALMPALVMVLCAGAALLVPLLPPVIVAAVVLLFGLLLVLWPLPWPWRLAGMGVAMMGVTWLQAGWVMGQQWPATRSGEQVQVIGRIVEVPRHQPAASRLLMQVELVNGSRADASWQRWELHWRDGRDGESDPMRATVKAGERWEMTVSVRPPRSRVNPGGFDASRHALANRVTAVGGISPGRSLRIGAGSGLGYWRQEMSGRIDAALPSQDAAFVRALALGDTGGMTADNWQDLRATGLTHLVAISGFHVTLFGLVCALLARALWRVWPRLFGGVPRAQAEALSAAAGALLYACAAGLGLPAVRTVLMVGVVCLARCQRRQSSVWQCLAWALMLVIIVDPLALLTAGFWLSFLGVAWLAWALGWQRRPAWQGLLLAQGVATVGFFPVTVFLFGQASVLGPLCNLLAIPWWSLVVVPLCVLGLLLEVVYAGLGLWAWQLAAAAFAPSWRFFSLIADYRLAELWLPEASLVTVVLALLAALFLLLPHGMPGKGLSLFLWLPLLWPQRELPEAGALDVQLLDVGQGLSLLLRTQHHAALFDAGPAVPDGFDAGERIVVPALRALGVRQLDRLIVSHADNDHAGGMAAVVHAYPGLSLHAPPGADLLTDLPVQPCLAGERWHWDGVWFEFLHPVRYFPYLGNDSSCVLTITAANGRVLLTGDISHVVEQRLLQTHAERLRADVVQVSHHGSRSASSGGFVRATQARLALVSAGQDNRFGHPHAWVTARWLGEGAEVLETARSGAIRVWINEDGIQVRERRSWRQRFWQRGD